MDAASTEFSCGEFTVAVLQTLVKSAYLPGVLIMIEA